MTTAATSGLSSALADRYRIERELGRGGMATVYLAHDVKHDRKVAIKVLDPELGAVLGADRFLGEIKVTANLQHPNLLPLFDSGEANGLLYYVMPFVDGETLRARLGREKQLSIESAVGIAVAVAYALAYAHERGIVHRDLKPENILFQAKQPVVADFGIALAVSNAGGQRVTQTGLSVGTPQYMSPEQAIGDRGVDARADIYALGAVLYEMVTGEPPHTGASAQAVIAKLLTEDARPVSVTRRNVPPHVEAAVARALEKLPADRFENAKDFAEALQGRGDFSSSGAGVRSQLARRMAGAREVLAWSLFASTAAASAWLLTRPRAAADAPVIRAPVEVPAGAQILQSNSGNFALSPRGDRLAFVVQDSAGGRIVIRRASEPSWNEVRVNNSPLTVNLAFSPDGEWIAYTDGFAIKKVRADGSQTATVGTLQDRQIRGLAWPPTDTILAGTPTGIWMFPAAGGTGKPMIIADSTTRHYWPVTSPDGKLVAFNFATIPDRSKLAVASLRDRKTVVLDPTVMMVLGFLNENILYVSPTGSIMALPFDARALRATGDPVQLEDSVRVSDGTLGAAAALSSSGTLVYLKGSSATQLVLAAPGRADLPVLPEARFYKSPRFSPDGKQIAVTIGTTDGADIHVYHRDLRTLTRLTSGGVPEWTSDGKSILFRSARDGKSAIWKQLASGAANAQLLYQPDDQVNEGILSPDEHWLVYRTGPASKHPSDIFAVPLTGDRRPIPIATGPGFEVMPRLSPDGRWIVYQKAGDGGQPVIYVQPFPAGAPIQVSGVEAREPLWARSGRAIYYRTQEGSVMSVAVTLGASLSLGERRVVLPGSYEVDQTHASYDVAPDGEHFLMLKRPGGPPKPIIIYNWGRELKEKLAGKR